MTDLTCPSNTADLDEADFEFSQEGNWIYRNARKPAVYDEACLRVRPTTRDINKRFHAILPYFDKDHSNTEFLHKFRATVHGMSEGEDLLDRETAFYAAVLTPIVFQQNYKDTWCLLDRFHRALRLYQISHTTEKLSSLKLLQNFRAVNQKVQTFVSGLPGYTSMRPRTTVFPELDEAEIHDKRDIRYVPTELVKNRNKRGRRMQATASKYRYNLIFYSKVSKNKALSHNPY
ncbi:uncharacterized protein LOC120625026 [Pararge aegeria]|uniref:uncharacterized protein LOC120625026 n=1 Tax=Pararge aegeria TaxID=116150 RepID=UPI0019D30417|nr:uncharacterized protein LOC120625026 [Pararge aegeria]